VALRHFEILRFGVALRSPDLLSPGELLGTPVRLQSPELSVDVLPDNGGRVASIRCRQSETEFLLGGSSYKVKAEFSSDVPFEYSDRAGMDECLPTVSLSSGQSGAVNAPDHGDLWRHAWRILERSDSCVKLTTKCFSLPLSFTRKLSVRASQLRFEYNIRNLAQTPIPFLYACHPLFAVEPGDRLILPYLVQCLYLHYSSGNRIGSAGELIAWPFAGIYDQQISLDTVGKKSDKTAEMLYAINLSRGICAIYRSQRHQAVVIRFNTKRLPHLGLWLCNGGWPDNPGIQKQYAVALEPTVAPYGSLSAAVAARSAPILKPRRHFNFSISMEILGCDRPWSYEEVARYIDETPEM